MSLVLILCLQGNEVVVYLQNEYLPSLNMAPDLIQVKIVCILVIINHQVFTTMPLMYWSGHPSTAATVRTEDSQTLLEGTFMLKLFDLLNSVYYVNV